MGRVAREGFACCELRGGHQGVPTMALLVPQLLEPPGSQEGGEREQPVRAQPAVDRSPFRKCGLSPAPLRQAVKLLASQEIKQRPGGRANRGWEGPPTQAMAKEGRVNGYPCSWHIWQRRSVPCPAWCAGDGSIKPRVSSALPTLPLHCSTLPTARSACGAGRGAMPHGTAGDGIGAWVAQWDPQESQGSPLSHKTPRTDKHPPCIPPVLPQLELGAGTWSELGDSPLGHLQWPLSNGNPGAPPTWTTVSQPGGLLLQWAAKPEPQKLCRRPHEEVPWGPAEQDTPGCCDAPGLHP